LSDEPENVDYETGSPFRYRKRRFRDESTDCSPEMSGSSPTPGSDPKTYSVGTLDRRAARRSGSCVRIDQWHGPLMKRMASKHHAHS
jgi:hypothetical protein